MGVRWVPVAVATGIAVVGGAWSIGPYLFEKRDHAISIDSPEVRAAALDACTTMQERVAAATTYEQRLAAAGAMVADLRSLPAEVLDGDRPTGDWLDDWDAFLAARRAGEQVPRAGGAPVYRRMDDLVKDIRPCQVPESLLPGRG